MLCTWSSGINSVWRVNFFSNSFSCTFCSFALYPSYQYLAIRKFILTVFSSLTAVKMYLLCWNPGKPPIDEDFAWVAVVEIAVSSQNFSHNEYCIFPLKEFLGQIKCPLLSFVNALKGPIVSLFMWAAFNTSEKGNIMGSLSKIVLLE